MTTSPPEENDQAPANRTEGRARYLLELEALPSEVSPAIRLRNLLKTALRRDSLRCLRAEEIRADQEGQAQ